MEFGKAGGGIWSAGGRRGLAASVMGGGEVEAWIRWFAGFGIDAMLLRVVVLASRS